jgi:hypothetical protein
MTEPGFGEKGKTAMFLRFLLVLGLAAFLTSCAKQQDTGNWYCDRMPNDSFCKGMTKPTIFDSM